MVRKIKKASPTAKLAAKLGHRVGSVKITRIVTVSPKKTKQVIAPVALKAPRKKKVVVKVPKVKAPTVITEPSMRVLTQAEFERIMASHIEYQKNYAHGGRANFNNVDFTARAPDTNQPIDLHNRNFRQAIFRGAKLSELNVCGANFTQCDMMEIIAEYTRFDECDLRDACLNEANLKSANFCQARLSYTVFDNSTLEGAHFGGADLQTFTPLHADTARGYVLRVITTAPGVHRFVAGCRNFTYEEAIEHWGIRSYSWGGRQAYVAAIEKFMEDNAD